MIDPLVILLALGCGVVVRKLGYPPMLGYLVAGFALHASPVETGEILSLVANAGVTLLLFSIGLKLNIRELIAPQVWGVAAAHMLLTMAIIAGFLFGLLALFYTTPTMEAEAVWIIAFALSFSSTVFAVKIFEERGEGAALHAQIAIGILIMQDLAAVVFLAMNTGKVPDFSLTLIFVVLCLLLARPLFFLLLRWSGHGELLLLCGIGLAFGGAALFEQFNIKGDLGALFIGMLLAGGGKSSELAKALLDLKDLLLVGFFVTIGLNGQPDMQGVLLAMILGLVVFIKPVLYFLLMTALRLRARTSLLASLALFNYSEFGLIVAALAADAGLIDEEWVVTIALALAISFFISVPFNTRAHWLYQRYSHIWCRFERGQRLSVEEFPDLGDTSILVLGMGRIGQGAYQYLTEQYGETVTGIEENDAKFKRLCEGGWRVMHADASDNDFWQHIDLQRIELVMVSLTKHSENRAVVEVLREAGYSSDIAVIARHPDQQKELTALGCIAFNLYGEAGFGFAEHVHKAIHDRQESATHL